MSNFTYVRLTKLQPLFNELGNTYVALATLNNTYRNNNNNNNFPTERSSLDVIDTVNAAGTDKVLLLIEDNNYLHTYDHRSTSTIILMIAAWILLIMGFVFCCCAECFGISIWRGTKHAATSRSGGGGSGADVERNQLERFDAINATTSGDDRANRNDPIVEICRRCPPDYEVESLPSYTIVSGLPSYDDALEEFRKAGIILTPSVVPVIKIFESHEATAAAATKELYSIESTQPQLMGLSSGDGNADTISLHSTTCTCGGIGGGAMPTTITAVAPQLLGGCAGNHQQTVVNLNLPGGNGGIVGSQLTSQVIELSPEHLAALSQKRLSLQISFNNSVRRPSRSGATLRNNLLRSRAVGNTAGLGPIESSVGGGLTPIHRSTSTLSLTNERQLLDQRLRHLHHRGSLY